VTRGPFTSKRKGLSVHFSPVPSVRVRMEATSNGGSAAVPQQAATIRIQKARRTTPSLQHWVAAGRRRRVTACSAPRPPPDRPAGIRAYRDTLDGTENRHPPVA